MNKHYRKIDLTTEIWERAIERASKLPIFEGSHRGLQANIIGCIGEVVFQDFLKHNQIPFKDLTGRTDLDYVVNQQFSIDVKTKDRTVEPKIHFDNSVPLYNHEHQRPDFYYFISLLRDKQRSKNDIRRFKRAFLLGGIGIETLEKIGKTWRAGEVDPSNNTKFWTDCINVKVNQLIPNRKILEIFKSSTNGLAPVVAEENLKILSGIS